MKLNYRTIGEGKPVIILHGLFGMSDNWQTFAKNLATNGYAVMLVDLRNHGHSPHDAAFDYPVMAADLNELIIDQNISKPILVGHSMGGKTAMQFVNEYPGIASGLVVIDISPFYYPVHHGAILKALKEVDLNTVHTRGEAEKILAYGITDTATRQFLMKNLYWVNDKQLGWRFNLDVINNDIENVGAATIPDQPVHLPVLFVRGSKSNYVDPASLNEIKKGFPEAELITIEDSGHWVQAEKPTELMQVLTDFMKQIPH